MTDAAAEARRERAERQEQAIDRLYSEAADRRKELDAKRKEQEKARLEAEEKALIGPSGAAFTPKITRLARVVDKRKGSAKKKAVKAGGGGLPTIDATAPDIAAAQPPASPAGITGKGNPLSRMHALYASGQDKLREKDQRAAEAAAAAGAAHCTFKPAITKKGKEAARATSHTWKRNVEAEYGAAAYERRRVKAQQRRRDLEQRHTKNAGAKPWGAGRGTTRRGRGKQGGTPPRQPQRPSGGGGRGGPQASGARQAVVSADTFRSHRRLRKPDGFIDPDREVINKATYGRRRGGKRGAGGGAAAASGAGSEEAVVERELQAIDRKLNAKRKSQGRYVARLVSAEDFSRLGALLFTVTAWIFIPAYCFAVP